MKDTKLPATTGNLIRLVRDISTSETLEMIKGHWTETPPRERLEMVMESWFSYQQEVMVVKIISTNTWGLILDSVDDAGDCQEYLELFNSGLIREWHEK